MAHINLGDTKAQVRLKRGLQSPEKDMTFTKFEVCLYVIPIIRTGLANVLVADMRKHLQISLSIRSQNFLDQSGRRCREG